MDKLPTTKEEYDKFSDYYYKLTEEDQIKVEFLHNRYYIIRKNTIGYYNQIFKLPLDIIVKLIKYTSFGDANLYNVSTHRLRLNHDFALETLLYNEKLYNSIPIILKLNKEFILKCIYALKNESIKFLTINDNFIVRSYLFEDFDITMAILQCKSDIYGIPFKYIHPSFKTNSICIDTALKNCIYTIHLIPEHELTDERIENIFEWHISNPDLCKKLQLHLTPKRIFKIIQHTPSNIRYIHGYLITKEIALEAVKHNGLLLEYIPKFNTDIDVITVAKSNNRLALIYTNRSFIKFNDIVSLCHYDNYTESERDILYKYIIDYIPQNEHKHLISILNQYEKCKLNILDRGQVLSFVKKESNIQTHIIRDIINRYQSDIQILSFIDLYIIIHYMKFDSKFLYKYLITTRLPILYNWIKIKQLHCLADFNIRMIYKTCIHSNQYLILFDPKYYDCKILNRYAFYYTRIKYRYLKLYLMRNFKSDMSFVFDNIIHYLIKFI